MKKQAQYTLGPGRKPLSLHARRDLAEQGQEVFHLKLSLDVVTGVKCLSLIGPKEIVLKGKELFCINL